VTEKTTTAPPSIPVADSREAMVGRTPVRRALPQRTRRTVGAWCFADHIGPVGVTDPADAGIGPHPHIGLQTVTWLLDGELRHIDSVGSDQVIVPGQLNLMSAGNGVAHAEEWRGGQGRYHGIQLWVAQPEATRHRAPAFEHHATLPRVEFDHATASVLVGTLGNGTSPARRDTDHVGAELRLRAGSTTVPVHPSHEHALIVLEGRVQIEATARVAGATVEPGRLAYLEPGCDEVVLRVDDSAVAMLIGGLPFEARVSMWWNFVGRNHDEITVAQRDWNARDTDRFGAISSSLQRIAAPQVPWRT
jgi:redox-sensitive bicupin YhaK (pirin superfamily)